MSGIYNWLGELTNTKSQKRTRDSSSSNPSSENTTPEKVIPKKQKSDSVGADREKMATFEEVKKLLMESEERQRVFITEEIAKVTPVGLQEVKDKVDFLLNDSKKKNVVIFGIPHAPNLVPDEGPVTISRDDRQRLGFQQNFRPSQMFLPVVQFGQLSKKYRLFRLDEIQKCDLASF
ncbi:hypothetical protein Fcan01_28149 [Folsomia candida]|uniref:Uncharacterized protein n=1 Tax=Folsomia candida TaxID=158441 RepID=A0A226CYF4_FOLCA|nr:hypothetical protein Fcan01_28149 [Folsomia candida]